MEPLNLDPVQDLLDYLISSNLTMDQLSPIIDRLDPIIDMLHSANLTPVLPCSQLPTLCDMFSVELR